MFSIYKRKYSFLKLKNMKERRKWNKLEMKEKSLLVIINMM